MQRRSIHMLRMQINGLELTPHLAKRTVSSQVWVGLAPWNPPVLSISTAGLKCFWGRGPARMMELRQDAHWVRTIKIIVSSVYGGGECCFYVLSWKVCDFYKHCHSLQSVPESTLILCAIDSSITLPAIQVFLWDAWWGCEGLFPQHYAHGFKLIFSPTAHSLCF